jgi:hypothetical protein
MNNKTIKNFAIVLVSILAISTIFSALGSVNAAGGSMAMSTPPSNVAIGSTFTTTISISGVTDVWQWSVRNIYWNSAVLQAMSVSQGSFLSESGVVGTLFPSPYLYSDHIGEISATRMDPTGVSGSGLLCTITFKVIGYGSTAITINGPASIKYAPDGSTSEVLTATGATYNGLLPPPPQAPVAVITSPIDGTPLLQGTTVALDGSNSIAGFDGTAIIPVSSYNWAIDFGNDGSTDLTSTGATGASFTANTIGQTKITLTVSATGCPTASPKSVMISVYAPSTGAAVDVYTQAADPNSGKGPNAKSDAFGPQEDVVIYANVTYNSVPVAQKEVAFEVRNAQNQTIFYRTAISNGEGLATSSFRLPWPNTNPNATFGNWTIYAAVDVSEVHVYDTCAFHFNYTVQTTLLKTVVSLTDSTEDLSFARDASSQSVFVQVTLENIKKVGQSGILTLTICDECNVPVAKLAVGFNLGAQASSTNTYELALPHFTFCGQAKVYANALTDFPSLAGVPYYPEVSKQFEVTRI